MSRTIYRPVAAPRILAAAASGVDASIRAASVDSGRVFELAGIDPGSVRDPSLRLGLQDYCRLIETAAEATGDALFGARFGRSFRPGNFGAVGALVVNAPTVLDGLRALARYYGWIQENSSLELRLDREVAFLDYQIYDARIPSRRQDAELTLAAFCGLLRHCLGPGWRPLETHFEHGRGGAGRAYEAIFGPGVFFDQPTNTLLLDTRSLRVAMTRPDPAIFAAAEGLIRHQLTPIAPDGRGKEGGEAFLALLGYLIESQCRLGAVGIASVAERLGLTVDGLRRRLREHELAYDDLVTAVRRDLGLRLVEGSDRSLTDIAIQLGYSELSAFSRAFRRWTGTAASDRRRTAEKR